MRNKVAAAIGLCTLSALLCSTDAGAVPGLNSANSVKEITKMLKTYSGSNAPNIYTIERELKEHPSQAGEALVSILDTADQQLQLHACQLLQRISSHQDCLLSDESVKTVIGILNASPSTQVQNHLLATLGNIGPKNDLVKATIVSTLKNSKEVSTRRAAVEALSRLAREEKPSLHAVSTAVLLETLKRDESQAVRAAAAGALGNYRDNPKVAIPALLIAMDDNYLLVRSRAAQALGQYGKAADSAVPKLLEALKTESDQSMRHNCFYALRGIAPNDPAVIQEFLALFDEPTMADTVMNYMHYIGPKGVAAVPKLITYLDNPNRQKRISAARALASIGPGAQAAIPALTAALQSNDGAARRIIETAIRAIQPATTDGAQAVNP